MEYAKHIGKGVYAEIEEAIRKDIPVFVMKDLGKTFAIKAITCIRPVNISNWKSFYGQIYTEDENG